MKKLKKNILHKIYLKLNKKNVNIVIIIVKIIINNLSNKEVYL